MPPARKNIVPYTHADKRRANNPPAGLVSSETDPDEGNKQAYRHDLHLDPQPCTVVDYGFSVAA